MSGALDGVKVLEFSEIIAAPFGCMQLADMGAEVIKVEPRTGDPWRGHAQFAPGENASYLALNRGKRGMALDLKAPEAREIIYKLVGDMDVVVVNYRPDTPAALGIDYETLRQLNDRLIYVQLTAFGSRGPFSHRPGYDIVAQALTGLMATNGKTTDANLPAPMSPPVADFASGIALVGAVSSALYVREQTGRGQKVELSLMASALAMQGAQVMTYEAAQDTARGQVRKRVREARAQGASWIEIREMLAEARGSVTTGYYRCYETGDGEILAVACLNPELRRKFREAVGVEDPNVEDPGRSREEMRAGALEFTAMCEVRMQEKTSTEWLDILDQAGVPAAPFRLAYELIDDPQVTANDMIVELDHPKAGHMEMVGPLFSMSENDWQISRPSPTIGQHTDEVLSGLGYDAATIDKYREKGIVGEAPTEDIPKSRDG